ncbi:MAG: type II secretion system F family protein [Desulfamplus sp.]|nr:type II secretion system F family protein [Desulfamplus sp.]
MTVFEYKAYSGSGKLKSGIIDADSIFSARSALRRKQMFPVSIHEIDTELSKNKTGSGRWPGLTFVRIGNSEISVLTRQMATLLSAGFPLVTAVDALITQTGSGNLQRVLSKIKASIEEGNSFSQALSQYPSIFSPVYINMITAGESSGTLELVLERLADITEKQEDTRKKIQASLAYPAIMAITGAGVLMFLITYIVPGIVGIFSDMNQQLPAPTRLLIAMSLFFKSFWWTFPLLVALAWLTVYLARRYSPGARYITDRLLLGLPKAGTLIKKSTSARFSRILGVLLSNGVPMLTALSISKNTTSNSVIQKKIADALDIVEQGGELGNALGDGGTAFAPIAIQMIQVGERSGRLEQMLEKSADLLERETQSAVTALTALLEPAIILVMGAVVGFIVLSVSLPIFEMNQLAR